MSAAEEPNAAPPSTSAPTDRTRVRRLGARGSYDLDAVKVVLDAHQVCHAAAVRPATSQELAATGVVRIPLTEASVKIAPGRRWTRREISPHPCGRA